MTLRKGQSKQPVFEDYQPSVEWSQDPETHLLRVDLPGFKKEELKVQVDSSRKLTVKGRRQEGEGRFICFEKSFDVPKDSIIEKINGRFEDGCLFLIMPKRSEPKQEACTSEPSQEKKEDSIPKEKPNVPEKKEEDSIPKEKQKVESQEKEDPIHKEKHKHVEEVKKKDEDPARREATKIYEEMKVRSSWEGNTGGDNGYFEKQKKKEVVKRKRKEKEEQGWVDFGLVDDFLEKINRNRKVIAVAFVAFSVGFCVSHKLRQRG